MARYLVKYQVISKGTQPSGPMSVMVTANGVYEAKQVFKFNHPDTVTKKYKVVAAVRASK